MSGPYEAGVCVDPVSGPVADGAAVTACGNFASVATSYLGGSAVVVVVLPGGSILDQSTQRWYSVRNIPADATVLIKDLSTGSYGTVSAGAAGFGGASGVGAAALDWSQFDTLEAAGLFAIGFTIVGTGWAIGRSFRFILNMIGK